MSDELNSDRFFLVEAFIRQIYNFFAMGELLKNQNLNSTPPISVVPGMGQP